MVTKDIKKIIKLCRENGILEIKHNGLELKFSPDAVTHKKAAQPVDNTPLSQIKDTTVGEVTPQVPWAKMTSEEIAVWPSTLDESEKRHN